MSEAKTRRRNPKPARACQAPARARRGQGKTGRGRAEEGRRRSEAPGEGRRREAGNMLVLGIGAWMVVAALLLVLSAASALYVERRDLLAEADSIALALADELDATAYYSSSRAPGADTPALAAGAAALARPGTSVVSAVRTGTGAVEVRLSREVPIPVAASLAPRATVTLTARARAQLRPLGRG